MIMIRDPKTIYFDFHWPKNVDENLKHETEFIKKRNESLAENKKKARLNNYCPQKTAKQMNNINLFLICHKD